MKSNEITIYDIAREAGVSTATISYVLNNKRNVRQGTREKVLSVIEKLGYHPSPEAQAIRRGKSDVKNFKKTSTLLFIAQKMQREEDTRTYDSDYIYGLSEEADRLNYNLMVKHVSNYDDVRIVTAEKKYDGIIISKSDREIIEKLNGSCPLIVLGSRFPGEKIFSVSADNPGGICQAVEHLKKLGHRKIGFACRDISLQHARERFLSFKTAMEAAGLAAEEKYNYLHLGEAEDFRPGKEMPTALVCSNDRVAVRMLHRFQAAGVAVPEKISLIGFDDWDYAQYTSPPLTTIHVPRRKMGVIAAQKLVDKIEGRENEFFSIEVPVQLIIRGTSAPIC